VEPPSQESVECAHFQLRILARSGDDEAIAFLQKGLSERICYLGEEGVQQIRHHKTNKVSPSRNQAARSKIWSVVNLLDTCQNSLASLFADIVLVSQDLRHSDDADPKIACDIFHRYWHNQGSVLYFSPLGVIGLVAVAPTSCGGALFRLWRCLSCERHGHERLILYWKRVVL